MRARFLLCTVLSLAVWALPLGAVQAAGAKDDVARMIRLLGYGAGIHNFKNFVLRDRDAYAEKARAEFTQALTIINGLESNPEMNSRDREALRAIEEAVASYRAGLDKIPELRLKGWRIEDMDRSVVVDDTAAVNGINTLRAKWNWSDFEEMEYQLGYGKAIHHFKNYVIRGHERYHTDALASLLAIGGLVAGQLRAGGSPEALGEIRRIAHAYQEYLGLVERMQYLQRPTNQIDLAVKINDGPATKALASLR
ncbi:MAG: hypothetical protein DRQ37_03570 [Gammaproteobacteria bacterium]|nr:MAG: hypothetical protein DRQ37_03570 [Gammaproteobacteria bacterium]